MNGVVPVLIVIRVCSVPTAVVRLERVMRPANAGVSARNDDGLSAESERPDIGRVRVINARLDRRRSTRPARLQRRLLNRARLREVIVDNGISLDARHVGAGCQCFGQLAITLHQNCVNDVERLMLDVALAQPLQDWLLRGLCLF